MSRETTEETEEDDNRQRAGNARKRFPPLLCWKSQTTSQPGGKHASRCAHKKSTLYCRLYSWGLPGKSVAIEESFRIPVKIKRKNPISYSCTLLPHGSLSWLFLGVASSRNVSIIDCSVIPSIVSLTASSILWYGGSKTLRIFCATGQGRP